MNKWTLAAASIAAAATMAGCGGGSDNKALSYSAFGTAASKVCTTGNAGVKAASAKLNGDPKNDAAVYDELIPKLQSAVDKFAKLKPPEALKVDFGKFNDLNDQQVALAKQAQADAKTGDQAKYIATVKKLQPLSEQSNLEASKLGAKGCIGA